MFDELSTQLKEAYGKKAETNLATTLSRPKRYRNFFGIHWLAILTGASVAGLGVAFFAGASTAIITAFPLVSLMLGTMVWGLVAANVFKFFSFRTRRVGAIHERRLQKYQGHLKNKVKHLNSLKSREISLTEDLEQAFYRYAKIDKTNTKLVNKANRECTTLKKQLDKTHISLIKAHEKLTDLAENKVGASRELLIKIAGKYLNRPRLLRLGIDPNLTSKYDGNVQDIRYTLHLVEDYIAKVAVKNLELNGKIKEITGVEYNSKENDIAIKKFEKIQKETLQFDVKRYEKALIMKNQAVKEQKEEKKARAQEKGAASQTYNGSKPHAQAKPQPQVQERPTPRNTPSSSVPKSTPTKVDPYDHYTSGGSLEKLTKKQLIELLQREVRKDQAMGKGEDGAAQGRN